MKICPHCHAEWPDSAGLACEKCGADLQDASKASTPSSNDDDLNLVVTESTSGDQEFVGGEKKFESTDDDLGIESPSDLMEREATGGKETHEPQSSAIDGEFGLIGESAPPPPPGQAQPNPEDKADEQATETAPEIEMSETGRIRKLSADDVKKIEDNLYSRDSGYLSDREKSDFISKMDTGDIPFANTPIEPPSKKDRPRTETPPEHTSAELDAPAMNTKRGKGVALYYRNYVQILGSQTIRPSDRLTLGERTYELQPRRFDTKIGLMAAAVLFIAILIGVGSQFISDPSAGFGRLAGVVLDDQNQPYLGGATVRLPEIGKAIPTNAQGLFRLGQIPEGTHRVEYVVDGRIVKIEYATVVHNETALLAMKTGSGEVGQEDPTPPPPLRAESDPTEAIEAPSQPAKQAQAGAPKPKSSSRAKKNKPAQIILAANVDDARFELDGKILGAGNLTYSGIKPGKHKYVVSRIGFEPYSGTINLSSGQKRNLKVELMPLSAEQQAAIMTETDHFDLGISALKTLKYEEAMGHMDRAIEIKPSYAEAYYNRGEVYTRLKDQAKAHDDYLRAAEIYVFRKDANSAITAFTRAIERDKKSVPALLGRGNAYLSKREPRAALGDFESAKKYDKRNYQAHFGLGEARFEQGSYKKATNHFKDARSIDSNRPVVYQYLMLCHMARGKVKDVKKSFGKFREVASEEQYAALLKDKRFTALLEVIDER